MFALGPCLPLSSADERRYGPSSAAAIGADHFEVALLAWRCIWWTDDEIAATNLINQWGSSQQRVCLWLHPNPAITMPFVPLWSIVASSHRVTRGVALSVCEVDTRPAMCW